MARTLVQNLRVGANWRSVIPALAKAIVLHKEAKSVAKVGVQSQNFVAGFRFTSAVQRAGSLAYDEDVLALWCLEC